MILSAKSCQSLLSQHLFDSLPQHEITLAPYSPVNQKAADFHTAAVSKKIVTLYGGNRSGKSYAGCRQLLMYAQQYPGDLFWACTESRREIGAYIWPIMKKALPDEMISHISWSNAGEEIPSRLVLVNGSVIQFKTYD